MRRILIAAGRFRPVTSSLGGLRRLLPLALALAAFAGLACGAEPEAPAEQAVEARETNVVSFGGIEYRVTMFRQINPRIPPDRALYDGPLPADDEGLYAAFIVACNQSGSEQTPTRQIHLEDAFGQVFRPVGLDDGNSFAYQPRSLDPDECLPLEDSAARRTVSGAAVVFRVPFEELGERPLVLVLNSADPEIAGARVRLDV